MKEILDWFVNGGKFTSYWRESVPYGERKNSKKRDKTFFFFAEKNGITFQLGHTTEKNYKENFWSHAADVFVKNALCKEGEFSYYNLSYVHYLKSKEVVFEDLGEKK